MKNHNIEISTFERKLNSSFKLNKHDSLVIGYFGGSITEGSSASDSSKSSWRALTTKSIQKLFPKSDITEVLASIGGTGSDLGVFRCDIDLLNFNPDLVFVEFAINDRNTDAYRIEKSVEGIIRKIRAHNSYTDIIFIYTTGIDHNDPLLKKTIDIYENIAEYYKISTINVGEALWKQIEDTKRCWSDFSIDKVHPNDEGFAIYAEEVVRQLKCWFCCSNGYSSYGLPEPLINENFESAKLVDSWDLDCQGWKRIPESLCNRYPHMIVAEEPYTELNFYFEGNTIGLYWMIAPDSGRIEWRIDQGEWQIVSSFDGYALLFTRANYVVLAEDLENTEHEVNIKISENKDEDSKGTVIRIGAILTSR